MGRVGYRVADLLLRLGERVTVITREAREEWAQSVRDRGGRLIEGDARNDGRLVEAGFHQARCLVAVTDQDLVNIEVALDGKRLCPRVPVVMRLFDQKLAQELESGFDIRRAMGMSALAAPTFAAAALGEQVVGAFRLDESMYVIGRITLDPHCPLTGLEVREVASRYGVAVVAEEVPEQPCEFAPEAGSRRVTIISRKHAWDRLAGVLVGHTKRTRHFLHLRKWVRDTFHLSALPEFFAQVWRNTATPLRTVFLLLAALIVMSIFVFRSAMDLSFVDALYFIVTTVTTVGYGDITPRESADWLKLYGCLLMLLGSAFVATLFSILTDYLVTARFQQLLGRQRIPQAGHVVVVGLGNVGYRVVEELRQAGARVVGIERDANREFVEALRPYVPIIIGDARAAETLARASISTAAAVVAATADDTVNLGVALAAERTNPNIRSVVRLFDPDFARKVQSALNVDAAMGGSSIAAPAFAAAALFEGVLGAFVLDDALFAVLQRDVGDDWEGRCPNELDEQREGRILMRRGPSEPGYSLALDDRPLHHAEQVVLVVRRRLEGTRGS